MFRRAPLIEMTIIHFMNLVRAQRNRLYGEMIAEAAIPIKCKTHNSIN